ncbi:crossover junction endonuclease MUS81 [Chelonus insularis]|uniref:crossover junction endonuclease MUS81 n=1 Tax=Chelonus insularis TaxID=460826 RepID=UPI00158D3D60|nr:crossover junction endonuclease MUS81 [Chelonus insularis]
MINIKVKRKRPNELFETWLEEWRKKAKLEKSYLEKPFSKALSSLKKYPLPLESGRDCRVLQNFGAKLCTMLDKKLEQYAIELKKINEKRLSSNMCFNRPLSAINEPNTKKTQPRKKKTTKTISSTSKATNSENIDVQPITMRTFDVILLVDNNETSTSIALEKNSSSTVIPYEVRHLKVGDFAWIARCTMTQKELVLPYIVERKRIDDLAASIKDKRFHEQKFRLKLSGIKNIIYMIEGGKVRSSMPMNVLHQAAINSLIHDGFTVKFTRNCIDSADYLSTFTLMLHEIFQNKELIQCSKEDLKPLSLSHDKIYLMSFEEFNQSSSKIKIHRVRDLFIKQLLQLKGVSLEAVMAIAELYPTPTLLRKSLIDAGSDGEKLLANVCYGPLRRKLGPTLAKTIFQLYTQDNLD